MPFSTFTDIARWAGTILSPPTTAATGLEMTPVVRNINGKICRNISTVNPPISVTTYYGPLGASSTRAGAGWFDTQQTGANVVEVSYFSNAGLQQTGGAGANLWSTDDLVNGPFTSRASFDANSFSATLSSNIIQRWWQVSINPGTSVNTIFTLNSVEYAGVIGNSINANTGAQNLDGVLVADFFNTNTSPLSIGVQTGGTIRNGSLATNTMKLVGTPLMNNSVYDRTPFVWHGNMFSGTGANTIWQPPSINKTRLMKYKIEIAADATLAGGAAAINLQFNQQLGTAFANTVYPFGTTIPYIHRLVVPGSAASSFAGWDSGMIDLGSFGVLGPYAGRALQMGIQVPQSTAAITSPTWTIASNQWEAATVGFKTNANLGAFRLVQSTSSIQSAGSFATAPLMHMVTGNSYFVFFRTLNAVGGAPTIVVTDTALNTYTTGTLVTNASDGANGSSIGVAYVINAVGNSSNVVTTTGSVNVPTQVEHIVVEYAGLNSGGGIDAAQVSATGNSTSPASGNYTPSTLGDLVFTFMATAATLAAVPTAPAAFVGRTAVTSAGTLAFADNFGNGSLATGQINVIAIGTEE